MFMKNVNKWSLDDVKAIVNRVSELDENIVLATRNLDNVTLLHSIYPTPAYTNEIIYIYKADNVVEGLTNFDEDEFLNVEKIKFQKLVDMCLSGEIKDAKTICAVMKADKLLNK